MKNAVLAVVFGLVAWVLPVVVLADSNSQAGRACGSVEGVFPHDSIVLVNSSGGMDIVLPDNWSAFVKDENAQWHLQKKASVSCSCGSGGDGCSPALIGGSASCVMSTCDACSKSGAMSVVSFDLDDEGIQLASAEEIRTLPRFRAEMLMIPQVRDAISAWHRVFGNDEKTGDSPGDDVVMVKIFGHVAAINVNQVNDSALKSYGEGVAAFGLATSDSIRVSKKASVTCHCDEGTGCVHESQWGVHFCGAGSCNTCTMDF